MDYSLWPSWGALVAAAGLTAAAAVTDFRCRRIPNVLTLSAFALGLLFRVSTGGLPALLDAGVAFAIGFGTLFVLWISGGGGAGDVKLMGALSVWIGVSLTLSVLLLSVIVVMLLTLAAPLFSRQSTVVATTARPGDVTPGGSAAGNSVVGTEPNAGEAGDAAEPAAVEVAAGAEPAAPRKRVTVAFAIPLVIATWIVLALDVAGVSLSLL